MNTFEKVVITILFVASIVALCYAGFNISNFVKTFP